MTDVNGLTAFCTQDVVVTDVDVPTITCAGNVNVNNDPGNCTAVVVVPVPTATADNCGVATILNDFNGTVSANDTYPVGTTTVTWTVTDVNGLTATCTQDVIVTDVDVPTITCAGNVAVNNDPGNCTAVVVVPVPTATADNCAVATIINDYNGTASANDTYPVGTTTVTWTVTDVNGLTATCTQDVIVTDVDVPTITCAGNVAANNDPGNCTAFVVVPVPTATADNCGVATILNDYNGTASADDTYPVGTTTITWEVTDVYGNTATCTQDVTVTDFENPTGTAPANVTVDCITAVPAADPLLITDEADNCGTPTVAFVSDVSDGNSCPEIISRTYEITDGNGNSIQVVQAIIVDDVTIPTASNLVTMSVPASSGAPAPDPLLITDEADNCSIPLVSFISDVTDGNSCPETITRTYEISDDCGNLAYVTQLIVLEDDQDPTASFCPTNEVTVSASFDPTDPTVTDNCGVVILTWAMTGATTGASPVTGVNYLGTTTFNSGVTTITYTAEDAAGNSAVVCTFTVEYTSGWICTLNASSTQTNASCFGASDGFVDVTVTGGISPLTTQWNTGATTEDILGVSAGNYTLTIVDDSGCVEIVNALIIEPAPIDITVNGNNATCGNYDGYATVSVNSGGTGPFSYSWTNGSSTPFAQNLGAGTYAVQVTDANGCYASGNVIINDANGPTISLSNLITPDCPGDNDGAIDVSISNGTPPYSYSWSNGSITEDLIGVVAGSYTLTLSDAAGCEALANYTMADPAPLNLTNATITAATCSTSDGQIVVTVSGGTGSYFYAWEAAAGGGTSSSASSLAAGAYTLTVLDGNGCQDTMTYIVNNAGAPLITEVLVIQPSCTGAASGSIDLTVSGGNPPYSFSWNSGQTTEDLTGIAPDVYELTVTDGSSCVSIYLTTISGLLPQGEDICMVTVDTLTITNLVVWTKTDTSGISHYNIYREGNSTGVYNLAGTQPFNQISEWTDLSANPSIKSWRYKISAVDSCGNESLLSPAHKSMHVTANLGLGNVINLFWDHYEGFTYGSYYIFRYHPSQSGWLPMDTLVSTSSSWTDANPPGLGNLEYMIEVHPPSTCTATKANDHNSTRSNRATVTGPGSDDLGFVNSESGMLIYPNPTTGLIYIETSGFELPVQLDLFDLSGRKVMNRNLNTNSLTIDLSNFENGVYILQLESSGVIKEMKIIKQ